MGLLDGDLAAQFAAVFGGFYLPASLHRATRTDDGTGSVSVTWADIVARAQVDAVTEAMRQAAGYTAADQRILVLAHDLVTPITTDDEISVGGARWSIASVNRDPVGAYYELHGQRVAVADDGIVPAPDGELEWSGTEW